ncbi:MAG: MarR family transcriptional regulator [Bradyrhizobiaceae bacterium]|nr:MarR family transcriptional regulator [Bradyrhizobiaceae bacterium]
MKRNVTDAITDLVLETFRLNGELLAMGDALVADLGLTSARWQVLGAVALSPVPLPVAHLARNMGLTRQAVQRIGNELAAGGLLRFAPNPHHRRAKLVLLTEKGRRAYKAATARWKPRAAALGKSLSAASIDQATSLLQTIRMRLEGAASSGVRHAMEKHP